ncbi:MAG: hypothetical protein SF123_18280 [Chloroflexota bacterium]|nr:hypothetical protein [Chloroflexota bacterium]
MKHGRRTLLILVIIFVALGVGVFIQSGARLQQAVEQATENRVPTIFPFITEESQIDAVRLQVPGSETVFTIARDPDRSWIAPGQTLGVDQAAATAIASSIVLLPYYRTLPNIPQSDLATLYGFNPGTLLITVLLNDGAQHAVLVGGLTPAGDTYYALVDQQTEVYVVERRAIDYLFVVLRDSSA